jgi:hypothetical protein
LFAEYSLVFFYLKEKKMKKSKLLLFLGVLILVLSGTSVGHAYSVTTYTSYVAWLTAMGGSPTVENFVDTTLEPGLTITEVGGAGSIHDGVYENIVDNDPLRYQIFNYNSMTAFGGWLDLVNPGGPGRSLDMYINDDLTFVMNVPNTADGGFYGFITDLPFTGVLFADGGNPAGIQETYYGIDIAWKAAVPIPPTAYLTIAGLLPFIRLRRKSSMA